VTQPRKTKFVSVNLTTGARDELQRMTLQAQADVGKRLSMSAVLLAALATAAAHLETFHVHLTDPNGADE
jgi:hypothetical protein